MILNVAKKGWKSSVQGWCKSVKQINISQALLTLLNKNFKKTLVNVKYLQA